MNAHEHLTKRDISVHPCLSLAKDTGMRYPPDLDAITLRFVQIGIAGLLATVYDIRLDTITIRVIRQPTTPSRKGLTMGRRRTRLDQRMENQTTTRRKNARRKALERARKAILAEAKATRRAANGTAM